MANVRIFNNADGTITLKHGRLVEHIDRRDKTWAEIADEIKWRAITIGIKVDSNVNALIQNLRDIGA
jgi:hypothetical protein